MLARACLILYIPIFWQTFSCQPMELNCIHVLRLHAALTTVTQYFNAQCCNKIKINKYANRQTMRLCTNSELQKSALRAQHNENKYVKSKQIIYTYIYIYIVPMCRQLQFPVIVPASSNSGSQRLNTQEINAMTQIALTVSVCVCMCVCFAEVVGIHNLYAFVVSMLLPL